MRTLILSDIHLGNKHCNTPLLEDVLERERFDRLVLNGDTLQSVNLRKLSAVHWKLVERFRTLAREREFVLLRGNHDHETDFNPHLNGANPPMGTHQVLPGLLGVPMREEYFLDIGSRKYLLLHGDRFDPTLRSPAFTEMAVFCYHLTTRINKKLAKWLKKKSKRWSGVLEIVRRLAIRHAQERNFDGIVTGHTHFSEDLHEDEIHYVNTGCWTEFPCSYVTVDGDDVELHHLAD